MNAGTQTDPGGTESAAAQPAAQRRRLFLALAPDPDLRQEIGQRLRKPLRAAGGRRVPVENLHITLIFLGHLDAPAAECVTRAAAAARGRPFTLTLDHIGYWKRRGLLWLGPRHTPAELFDLVRILRTALAACPVTLEDRPFLAHMTLARKVFRHPADPSALEPLTWPVDRFVLMESCPLPDGGVEYREVAGWDLRP